MKWPVLAQLTDPILNWIPKEFDAKIRDRYLSVSVAENPSLNALETEIHHADVRGATGKKAAGHVIVRVAARFLTCCDRRST